MSESNITKQALSNSLKQLMNEIPFDKISVGQICERCGMSRKSFYYHFKDKYDLVNWIFDSEIIKVISNDLNINCYQDRWKLIEDTCDYFYENRRFYRKALQIKGQNSFCDHFREFLEPVLKYRLSEIIGNDKIDDFVLNFCNDAIIDAMVRWIGNVNCMDSKEFVHKLKYLTKVICATISDEMEHME
ncbi:TetR/AcrR family transcriptional regulator C-terminal domain-containing protein [Floccifex sp.]|uniref:TetR/AcrR family transcriptional regulator C-terminal domain-containing protein n=1 Tax=Floccifex sp. TaxID=2815810 RepID=UPI0029FF4BBB|nr:TetR/AcrR family transcriptional regulator C-terminal domain-containing protein [Floccifex sp.]MDD7281454.1 TetR/AcrR family transcriptional regulator C-terminal domain-containing protein [Erysipelotrichaceae bacterium]MDY2957767.1 TetR/AcrR family transcriptional regulator C-terminal domain-containing protein [Floccifex sp.]